MEVRRGFGDVIDANGVGQEAIDGTPEIARRNRICDAYGGDLRQRVDSRIGSAGTRDMHRTPLDRADYFFERALNSRQPRLHLPPVEIGAIVGDFKAESPHDATS
jgi:hypothetical protein